MFKGKTPEQKAAEEAARVAKEQADKDLHDRTQLMANELITEQQKLSALAKQYSDESKKYRGVKTAKLFELKGNPNKQKQLRQFLESKKEELTPEENKELLYKVNDEIRQDADNLVTPNPNYLKDEYYKFNDEISEINNQPGKIRKGIVSAISGYNVADRMLNKLTNKTKSKYPCGSITCKVRGRKIKKALLDMYTNYSEEALGSIGVSDALTSVGTYWGRKIEQTGDSMGSSIERMTGKQLISRPTPLTNPPPPPPPPPTPSRKPFARMFQQAPAATPAPAAAAAAAPPAAPAAAAPAPAKPYWQFWGGKTRKRNRRTKKSIKTRV